MACAIRRIPPLRARDAAGAVPEVAHIVRDHPHGSPSSRDTAFRSTTVRLSRGISTTRSSPEPLALGDRHDLVEIPHAPLGVPHAEVGVEPGVALGRVPATSAVGAVEQHEPARPHDLTCAREEPQCRGPRADVDHVDAHEAVEDLPRREPHLGARVESKRREHVPHAELEPVRVDARERRDVAIARLPHDERERRGEERGVLPRTARDLEDAHGLVRARAAAISLAFAERSEHREDGARGFRATEGELRRAVTEPVPIFARPRPRCHRSAPARRPLFADDPREGRVPRAVARLGRDELPCAKGGASPRGPRPSTITFVGPRRTPHEARALLGGADAVAAAHEPGHRDLHSRERREVVVVAVVAPVPPGPAPPSRTA
jgi:hypothetical protein